MGGIVRQIDENTRERWHFALCSFGVILIRYEIERRSEKGRFRGAVMPHDVWHGGDERPYYSRLPRPIAIPPEVLDAAIREFPMRVYIGHSNQDSLYAKVDICLAPTASTGKGSQ